MAAHRYWRIVVSAVDGSTTYSSVGEIELLEGATDRTTGRGAYASQTGNGAVGTAADAVDNNQETEAGSSLSLPWIWSIDLGAAYDIGAMSIRAQRVVPDRTPTAWDVQYSDNNADWSTQASISGETGWAAYERREFTVVSYSLSGTVLDDAGDPCARTVRAYRRDTGALVGSDTSDSGTGAFGITTSYSGAHTVVALDDDAGTDHNALIFDRVTPV